MGHQLRERVLLVTQHQRVFWLFFLCAFTWTTGIIAMAQPVLAQTVVDMRPAANAFIEWAAGALLTVLTVLGGFGLRFITAKIGLANSEFERSLNDRLNEIIHRGIDYAYTTAQNEVNKPGSGITEVKFDNWFMAMAATYVVRSAPEIIKKFNLTQERIEQLISARMPAYLANVPIAGGLPSPKAEA